MKIKNFLPTVSQSKDKESDHRFYSLQREMNNLFDDFFRGFDISSLGTYAREIGGFRPSIDIRENEKEIIIRADLPGVNEKDIEVSVTADSVTIRGEKKEEKEDKGKNYYYMERSYGSFNRVIPLSSEIESGNVAASFKNGVLNITLPKNEKQKPKGTKIAIKTA
jgi:HSP20 family protein